MDTVVSNTNEIIEGPLSDVIEYTTAMRKSSLESNTTHVYVYESHRAGQS